jgi:hypothetical protein
LWRCASPCLPAASLSSSRRGCTLRQAAVRIGEALGPQDEVCVFGFSDSPYRIVDWTNSRDTVHRQAWRLARRSLPAIYEACNRSENGAAILFGNIWKMVIIGRE